MLFERFLPELPDTAEMRDLWARTQRLSASRGLALQYFDRMLLLDSEPALPLISSPTLVLQGSYDEVIRSGTAGALAS